MLSAISIFPVGILGAGTMGTGIAQLAASSNHTVYLYDVHEDALDKAITSIQRSVKGLVDKGKIPSEVGQGIMNRIHPVSDLALLDKCRIVIEAVVETLEVKQQVFRELEGHVSESCILASNTSSLSIASIAASCKKPDRFIGLHFFNPAPVMPLVEVVPGIGTPDGTVSVAKNLIESWGKIVVVTKDTPGFIVNRVARPFYGESIRILDEGIADVPTIDWALKEFGGFRMGPFELMDFIGTDINYKVTETIFQAFFYDPRYKPSLTQQRLYEAKRFGRKTGIGFYDYSSDAPEVKPNTDSVLGKKIFERVLAMLINEAAEALYLQVATRDDIDLAVTKGVNYPKGLLKWADEFGIPKVVALLQELQDEYSEDRYRTSPLLKQMSRAAKTFY